MVDTNYTTLPLVYEGLAWTLDTTGHFQYLILNLGLCADNLTMSWMVEGMWVADVHIFPQIFMKDPVKKIVNENEYRKKEYIP